MKKKLENAEKIMTRSIMTRSMVVLFTAMLSLTLPALAADVFQWEDSEGRVYFGDQPPKAAKNIKKVPKHTISRYSSEKLLNAYRTRARLLSEESEESSLIQETVPNPTVNTPKLKYEPVRIAYDSQHRVEQCSVVVKNIGGSPAQSVIVSFEFSDGTLVQASGPGAIAVGDSALYKLDESSLPLALAFSLPETEQTPSNTSAQSAEIDEDTSQEIPADPELKETALIETPKVIIEHARIAKIVYE